MDNKGVCLLYGASGHGKVIIDTLYSKGISIPAVFDDNKNINDISDIKVYEYNSRLYCDSGIIISIGDNKIRREISLKVKHSFLSVAHSDSIISQSVVLGNGSVVFAGAILQSSTIIGKHVIINTKASVDHDCIIGDFVHVAPGATICGGVKVGEGAFIGAGAVISPNIKIGEWAVIGAGAIVINDIGDNETWVGNPARRIK